MKKLFSTLLIITGLIIALIPIYNYAYSWYWQKQTLESYESLDAVFLEEPENTSTDSIVRDPNENIYFPPELQTPEEQSALVTEPGGSTEATAAPAPAVKTEKPKAIGVLKIDKIKSKLPIFAGATNSNLKIGVGWMKETTPIGSNGNAALAAHRSHTFGRFFNRLDEIVIDDTFTITVGDKVYRYVVFNKIVVEPTDVSVLKQPRNEQIVTLITCTPFITATHRLIIQGRLY